MEVIFIHHSCFVVEIDEKVLIFDWFQGDRVNGFSFQGVIPEYASDTPIYVFASHKHQDHFDMDVLRWSEKYSNIHYIFSKDCKMSPNFLKKHGLNPDVLQQVLYVTGDGTYHLEDGNVEIETLRSNDAGVAFYVKTEGVSVYHAGDLNNWKWDGAGELVNGKMEREYKFQIKHLAKKHINLAFVPFDPRQGVYQGAGMQYFLEHTDAEYVFPMHMWQDYSGIASFKGQLTNQEMAERIIEISHENQTFTFRG